jgi:hypothetical protein
VVGAGGPGGNPAGAGGPGSQSNWNGGVLWAIGGTGGQPNGGVGGTGGNASAWATNVTGGDGFDGADMIGGDGGNAGGPNGGNGGNGGPGGIDGSIGGSYGGGGGGGGDKVGNSNPSGGQGASGAVIITYTSTVTLPDAGADQNLCGITNLAGNTPDAGWTATWTTISGPGSATSPNNPSSGLAGINPGTCTVFEYSFSMAGCPTQTDQVTICAPVICNDDPCGAMTIPISTSGCSYTQYSNTGSTATTGVTEPGCANYDDNDVWFQVTVPANGQVSFQAIDNGAPGSVYPGIAIYDGPDCSNLSHAGCDQTTSTGAPSEISYNGTPGETIWIRVWDWLDSESGFGLCAFTHNNTAGDIMPGATNTLTCGTTATFMDPGGTGNYMVNSAANYTICPDTPGQYITVDFSLGFFDIENGWDRLTILDGSQTDAPIIGQYTGTNSPGVVTSGAADGCLTFQFQSDNIVTDLGWEAIVSCSPTQATNTYVCSPTNCSGECGQWICADGLYPTTNDGNGIEDLAIESSGCFGTAGEVASKWFYFTVLSDGTIEFIFDGPNGQDYDFAIWGPSTDGNPPCPMNTGEAPIRCSYADVSNTANPVGLSAALGGGEYYEGAEGDGWVDALDVVAGETYAMILNIFMTGNPQPEIDLTIGGSGTLDCTPVVLPITLVDFYGINQGERNLLSWITSSEMNNDYFTVEGSINGYEWYHVGDVKSVGNSHDKQFYQLADGTPNIPVTYYRLIQVDVDGGRSYSDVIAVNANRGETDVLVTELFPNPTNSFANFTYTGDNELEPLNVTLKNEMGQTVQEFNYISVHKGMTNMLNVEDLKSGVYQVIFTQGNQRQVTRLALIK